MIVLDTSFVLALLNRSDARHDEAARWYAEERSSVATTPLVLAELDHLLRRRATPPALKAFHRDVRAGGLGVEWWAGLAEEATSIAERYADLKLGLTDASLIALAAGLETSRIATFDERHFRAVSPAGGKAPFVLLPTDA